MHRKLHKALGFLILFTTLGVGAADAQAWSINARQRYQRHRIWNGFHDGSLTRHEARHLFHQQWRTERVERRMRHSGGFLSPWERGRLDHRLDRQSGAIYRNRHNGWMR